MMGDSPHKGHRERMKQRFLRDGLTRFDPHQIIEMLLYFGIPRKDTNEIAHELINTFGSLSGVLKAPHDDLLSVKGMTPGAATLLSFSGQLIREYYNSELAKDMIIDSTEKMGQFVLPKFFGEFNEKVLLICLDNKCKVLHSSFVSEGSLNATEINVRRILEQAIRNHATAVVIAHNHPSGFALPSIEDQKSTKVLTDTLSVAGIQFVDHLVVADDDYVSLRSTPSMAHLFIPSSKVGGTKSSPG
ncbi:MAG: DNA repair protein RadC [Oscillospiraceae bacterium]|nr:DNA repair protein RadC [Oscillospiraceae bacterium]MDD4546233.1 DNA repair protein RadC [Oscillospiraceae bacterium]